MDFTVTVIVTAIIVFLSVFTCAFLFIYPLILSLMTPGARRESTMVRAGASTTGATSDSLSTDDTVINYPKRRSIAAIPGHSPSVVY